MWQKIKVISGWLWGLVSHPVVRRSLLAIVVFGSLVFMLAFHNLPTRSLGLGDVCPFDIEAPQSVEFINQKATNEARMKAASSVDVVYTIDHRIWEMSEKNLQDVFNIMGKINIARREKDKKQIAELEKKLPFRLSPSTIGQLSRQDPLTLNRIQENIRNVLWEVSRNGITPENLKSAKARFIKILNGYSLSAPLVEALQEIGKHLIVPNLKVDLEATAREQQEAMARVEPVRTYISKGQVIIRKGDIVTPQHLEILSALGLYRPRVNWQELIGYVVIALFTMALTIIYLGHLGKKRLLDDNYLLLMALVVIPILFACRWFGHFSPYLAPVAASSMLLAILVEMRVAIFFTAIMSFFVGIFTGSIAPAVVSIFCGISAVLAGIKIQKRWDLVTASIVIIGANVFAVLGYELAAKSDIIELARDILLGGLNGLASGIVAIGALPLLENLFGITTHFRLLELSNPSEPLLNKLMTEAPGTYHHSIIVGNLAEAAARVVGADPLLARVGSYYHDIGKIRRPYFFVENQLGEQNPHDKISPSLSHLVITSHVKDGVELARKHHLPEPVIDIMEQHHGNSLLSYFYQRAKKINDEADKEEFRYNHPKPVSKEAAIIMLADACEAAVRALNTNDPNKIGISIRNVIRDIVADGQLEESELSMRDVSSIINAFTKVLTGIYHARIEYPKKNDEQNAKKRKKKKEPHEEPENSKLSDNTSS
ncbi:MAG: HDIG domain-containing protein [Candidatus Eremiobacteraeota bacterium]|nr:HDIG domain-containing protein [Candidatus Eremiobacteraeota bacterium]